MKKKISLVLIALPLFNVNLSATEAPFLSILALERSRKDFFLILENWKRKEQINGLWKECLSDQIYKKQLTRELVLEGCDCETLKKSMPFRLEWVNTLFLKNNRVISDLKTLRFIPYLVIDNFDKLKEIEGMENIGLYIKNCKNLEQMHAINVKHFRIQNCPKVKQLPLFSKQPFKIEVVSMPQIAWSRPICANYVALYDLDHLQELPSFRHVAHLVIQSLFGLRYVDKISGVKKLTVGDVSIASKLDMGVYMQDGQVEPHPEHAIDLALESKDVSDKQIIQTINKHMPIPFDQSTKDFNYRLEMETYVYFIKKSISVKRFNLMSYLLSNKKYDKNALKNYLSIDKYNLFKEKETLYKEGIL